MLEIFFKKSQQFWIQRNFVSASISLYKLSVNLNINLAFRLRILDTLLCRDEQHFETQV